MKKVMYILGIVVLCIIALVAALMVKNYFDSKKPLLSDDYYTVFKSDSKLEKSIRARVTLLFQALNINRIINLSETFVFGILLKWETAQKLIR